MTATGDSLRVSFNLQGHTHMRIAKLLAAILFLLLALQTNAAWARKWTARTGNFTVEAELVDVTGGNTILKKEDGTTISVPLEKLSLADVRYIQQVLREATGAVDKPQSATDKPAEPTDAAKASPPAKAKAGTKTRTPRPARDTGGPPLARPNSSRWQAAPDPPAARGASQRIGDVAIWITRQGLRLRGR
ncbi:MAG TPA: SHD1 domain-containing protein [Pirellulaceae bacterium]|nr:SHD1 domain-containing protein [Pirellulaceae bacterium]